MNQSEEFLRSPLTSPLIPYPTLPCPTLWPGLQEAEGLLWVEGLRVVDEVHAEPPGRLPGSVEGPLEAHEGHDVRRHLPLQLAVPLRMHREVRTLQSNRKGKIVCISPSVRVRLSHLVALEQLGLSASGVLVDVEVASEVLEAHGVQQTGRRSGRAEPALVRLAQVEVPVLDRGVLVSSSPNKG